MPTIYGFRDAVGRPRVRVAVRLPSLGEETIVDFVVDTGADRTMIHGRDRSRFASEPVRTGSGLAARARVSGISGTPAPYAVEDAEYIFEEDDGALWSLAGDVHVALDVAAPGVPSLLGRDVLDRVLFCISAEEITLEW